MNYWNASAEADSYYANVVLRGARLPWLRGLLDDRPMLNQAIDLVDPRLGKLKLVY